MKKNHGKEEHRARDLFYALWVPDLFMKRVKTNGNWTLMCPNECPGLSDTWGEEFEKLYEKYEAEGRGNKTLKAQSLWNMIIDSQIENLKKIKSREDEILNKQIKEAEIKAEENERIKREKREALRVRLAFPSSGGVILGEGEVHGGDR